MNNELDKENTWVFILTKEQWNIINKEKKNNIFVSIQTI